ncbi:folate-binding protein [Brachybacterium ginsengisoli]|uniref:Folate-binding protein n=1 Tax=Brachybacterium ginsengisoli TaxID=1331682 RepID=A0A291GV14_9MICO|nr:glycine cleavage T C-terminal barrel domain-containing protein [Brachybacterium ginsengisoli]ATG53956.1 folate-binding protein [Brachybacterium ginsengisoli]
MPDLARDIRPLLRESSVLGDGPDAAVPAHYGAPLREQRHLLDGSAVVDLGHLELLEVRGADARSWMTTITTQVLTGTPIGSSSSLAVLSPQGRVEHMASAVVLDEEALLLVLDAGCRAGLRRYLEMMRFAARVELTDRDDLRVLGGLSPAAEILPRLGLPDPVAIWTEAWPEVAPGGVAYGPDPEDPVGGVLTVLDAAALEELPWRREDLAGMTSWEALRIADHRARAAREVDERSIPHELDLLRTAVHTAKGCYRGQETVAKVLNLGQPPRRLVMLHLDGSQDMPVAPGGEVRLGGADGKVVGTVTSAALHADLGPIALAVVRRAVPLDAALSVQVRVGEADDDGSGPALWIDAAQEPIVVPREHDARPATAKL